MVLMEDEVSDEWQQQENYGYQQQQAVPTLDPINWTASEFISHQKTATWFVGLGVIAAVVTVIVFVLTRNFLSALVVAAACMALGVLGARKPQIKNYLISDEGVVIDDRSYPFGLFKSFAVVDEGALGCIWLRPLKKYAPTVAMYYPPDQEEKIIMMLDNFLPQEDRQHDMVDKLSRRIRF